MGKRHNQHGLIQIGGYDVSLFRQIAGTAYNIVLTGMDIRNVSGPVGTFGYHHAVADGHRVGRSDPFESEASFNFAIYFAVVIRSHGIAAAGVSYYKSVHVVVIQ